ncbi:TetR/AcrR family transcriptional regulator [Halioxenophilus aromaticivorans]|uniref:TetR/AcrR family transcriptional regulator n=1 Tax=Halioxenophilus aromaticivorans TaxID=1306992 RepID=A0AAV3U6G5_9ALTE
MSKSRHNSKVETIRQILLAARQEFSENGLDKANVQKIAERAGVTKQLVYHYYQSKEQLFSCVLDETSDNAMTAIIALELNHLPAKEALRVMIEHIFAIYENDPEMAALATEGIRFHDNHTTPRNQLVELGPTLTARMRSIIERGVQAGDFSDHLNPDLIFTTASIMVSGTYTNRYVIEALSGMDTRKADQLDTWKEFTINLIMSALTKPSPDQ